MTQPQSVFTPRAQRFPFRVPLSYRKSDDAIWHTCKTVNVSRTGILFRSNTPLPPNAAVDIRVRFPLRKTLCCQGTVVRTQKSEYAVRIYHCQFKTVE
jgi:hypothetical protein